jgi:hypothetical protein
MALASAVMALCCWGSCAGLERWLGVRGLLAQLATGLAPVILGALVYLALAHWWRIPEAAAVLATVQRQTRRAGSLMGLA